MECESSIKENSGARKRLHQSSKKSISKKTFRSIPNMRNYSHHHKEPSINQKSQQPRIQHTPPSTSSNSKTTHHSVFTNFAQITPKDIMLHNDLRGLNLIPLNALANKESQMKYSESVVMDYRRPQFKLKHPTTSKSFHGHNVYNNNTLESVNNLNHYLNINNHRDNVTQHQNNNFMNYQNNYIHNHSNLLPMSYNEIGGKLNNNYINNNQKDNTSSSQILNKINAVKSQNSNQFHSNSMANLNQYPINNMLNDDKGSLDIQKINFQKNPNPKNQYGDQKADNPNPKNLYGDQKAGNKPIFK